MTPLHCAARKGQTKLVEFLLSKGADANAKTILGQTYAEIALKYGQNDVIQFFLQKTNAGSDNTAKASVNLESGGNISEKMLFQAADSGSVDDIVTLINAGIDPNCEDSYGHSPLHNAVLVGQLEAAQALLDNGADVDWQDKVSFYFIVETHRYMKLHVMVMRIW